MSGSTWFVTGCSGGLGLGIVEAALVRRCNVVAATRDPVKIRHLEERFPETAMVVRMDPKDRASMRVALDAASARFGAISVLVNNAGHGYRAAIEESEPYRVSELFDTNFFAPMDLIRMVLPGMRERGEGTIVNITSIAGVRGTLGSGYYSASKGALEMATEALAKETAHLGIRTMIVEPGPMRTRFYGDNLVRSRTRIPDYDAVAGRYHSDGPVEISGIRGDPVRAGWTVVDTVLSRNMPSRLVLGSDAVADVEDNLSRRLAEIERWKGVSVMSDYPDDGGVTRARAKRRKPSPVSGEDV